MQSIRRSRPLRCCAPRTRRAATDLRSWLPSVGSHELLLVIMFIAVRGGRIVVEDGADSLAVHDVRIRRATEVDGERLVLLLPGVPEDRDGNGCRRLAGGEGERSGGLPVVIVGRRGGAVRRREVDVDPLLA